MGSPAQKCPGESSRSKGKDIKTNYPTKVLTKESPSQLKDDITKTLNVLQVQLYFWKE